MTKLFCRTACASLLGLVTLWVSPQPLWAEQPDIATTMSSRFVPADAIAIATASPQELLKNPALELFPVEVLRVLAKEQFGIDPLDISIAQIVVGLDDDNEPKFAIVLQLSGDMNFAALSDGLALEEDPISIGKQQAFAINGQPETVVCQIDPRTVFIGTASYLEPTLATDATAAVGKNAADGPLPKLLRETPTRPGIHVAVAMESIQQPVGQMAMEMAPSLAPDLQPLCRLPEFTDAVTMHLSFDEDVVDLKLTLVGASIAAAATIEQILKDSLLAAQGLGVAEIRRTLESSGQSVEMQEATRQYADRIAGKFVQAMVPRHEGDRVTLTVHSKLASTNLGMFAGMMMPALSKMNFKFKQMDTSNHFKQVMLAMHNYHAAYDRLPNSAIVDAEGKPLLSWRVSLLPFMEEQALYQQFHLDEPWDSEHNLPLSKKLPAVYSTPRSKLPPGETVIQALVGDTIGMRPLVKTGFRDFLDGLSNSILIVETNPESAVPWSKPADIEIDLAKPLEHLQGSRDKGFYIGMGDGAVKFVTDSIAPELLKALFTRAGKEPVDF